jgi:hypothetical protein
MRRPTPRPGPAAVLLAGNWAFVAYWFLYREYAQINLAAEWFALAFLLQAVLLLAVGVSRRLRRGASEQGPVAAWHPGMLLFVYALLIHPLMGLPAGRPWQGVELFGVAPDATALATLGILLTVHRSATWALFPIPLAWCAISALTYVAMGHAYGIAPLVLAIAALAATIALHRQDRLLTHRGDRD